jgi:hypothetical protein
MGYTVAQLVETMSYKLGGHRFDSSWGHWKFFIDLILHYGGGVNSASNRNDYMDKGSRCTGLTTLPPSCANCQLIWEPQTPGTHRAYYGTAVKSTVYAALM